MQAATSLTLSQHDNIIAIKEASGDLSQCQEIFNGKPENFQVISGDDMLTVDLINMGGIGVISVLANAFPGIFHNITQGAFQNDENRYIDSFKKLQHLNPLIYEESSATGIKLVLSELGICKPTVRPPLYAASNNLVERIKKVLVSFD